MTTRTLALILSLLGSPALAQAPAPAGAAPDAAEQAEAPPAPAEAAPEPAALPAAEVVPAVLTTNESTAPGRPAAAAPGPAQVSAAPETSPDLTDPASGPGAPMAAPPAAPGTSEGGAPPDPASAPPAPARLTGAAPAAPAPPATPWPSGIEQRPGGGLRLRLATEAPDAAARRAIEEIGRRLAATPAGRITVEVQVSGHPRDASLARRAALGRAQAVKAALVAGGLPDTRIDLRPLGRLDPPADLVDILPPGAARAAAPR